VNQSIEQTPGKAPHKKPTNFKGWADKPARVAHLASLLRVGQFAQRHPVDRRNLSGVHY